MQLKHSFEVLKGMFRDAAECKWNLSSREGAGWNIKLERSPGVTLNIGLRSLVFTLSRAGDVFGRF